MKKYLLIILFLFSNFNVLNANERVTKLNKLFNDLKINNYSIASKVEQKIWEIWSTHPNNKQLTSLLA